MCSVSEEQVKNGVIVFTLKNTKGMTVRVMNRGATLLSVEVPDKDGAVADVCCGFDDPDTYLEKANFSATVGRYANRIALGRFKLDGKEYKLAINNGPNHLHGGPKGFYQKIFAAQTFASKDKTGVVFTTTSAHGEEHFPGNLDVKMTYTLTNRNQLRMQFEATTDRPTIVNMCNHAYWNLAGHSSGSVLKHIMHLNASRSLPVSATLIPTGAIEPVQGTPLDFTSPKTIGKDIKKLAGIPGINGGYDHCFVINREHAKDGELVLAGKVTDPASGRSMTVHTTAPGVQIYTANHFTPEQLTGKGGAKYAKFQGVCLETQAFPDSPNKPHFPSPILRPGQTYKHVVVHTFSSQPRAAL